VLLVEDHQLVAEGIQALLGREDDIKVIGVAGTVKDAVAMSAADSPD
jgi:DNA-binding NarL/FixJ family response regulator